MKQTPYFRKHKLQEGGFGYYFELPKHIWKEEMPFKKSTPLGKDEDVAQLKAWELYNKLKEWKTSKTQTNIKSSKHIWKEYIQHRLFKDLSDRTKQDYEYVYSKLPLIKNSDIALLNISLDLFNNNLAENLYYQLVEIFKERTSLKIMALLRLLFNFGKQKITPSLFTIDNPFANLRLKKTKPKRITYPRNHILSIIQKAKEKKAFGLALAVELNYYICQRPADVVKLHRNQIFQKNGNYFFEIIQGKRKKDQEHTPLKLPIPPYLLNDILSQNGYIILNELGQPFTRDGLQKRFRAICEELGYYGYHFHLMRNTGSTVYAELGVNTNAIIAITGHTNEEIFNSTYKGNTEELSLSALNQRLEKEKNLHSNCDT